MTDSSPEGEDVFDLDRIRQLVELMKEHDLAQVDLCQGPQRIRLKRAAESPGIVGHRSSQVSTPSVSDASAPAESHPPADSSDGNVTLIKSPMVGTFYTKANPETEAFVKVGDLVSPDSTVCIIEAMKVFNEIPADVSGRVVAILVDNEEPVEFGKPLFKVDISGQR